MNKKTPQQLLLGNFSPPDLQSNSDLSAVRPSLSGHKGQYEDGEGSGAGQAGAADDHPQAAKEPEQSEAK